MDRRYWSMMVDDALTIYAAVTTDLQGASPTRPDVRNWILPGDRVGNHRDDEPGVADGKTCQAANTAG